MGEEIDPNQEAIVRIPIDPGDSGTFGLKISFTGSANGTTSFCAEQIPTPEPASLALLALGGLAMIRRRA